MKPDDLEPVWRALANPVRREMLDRLRDGPMATGDLVLSFPDLSRFAVMQHLGVLEEARLVVAHRLGRVRMNCLNVVPIRLIMERWISRYEALWADHLIALKGRVEGRVDVPRRARRGSLRGRADAGVSRVSLSQRKPSHA